MWALSRRRITNTAALSVLNELKEKNCYDSSTWFLPSHIRRLEINLLSVDRHRALISSELLRSDTHHSAYPFTLLPETVQKSIVFCVPPPAAKKSMIVTKREDGSLHWKEANDDEMLDASLHANCEAEQLLLCSPCVEPEPSCPSIMLPIFNAHECGNPFQIDPTLQHMDIRTNTPLPPSFTSGLTTLVSQFRMNTFRWLRAQDVSPTPLDSATSSGLTERHSLPSIWIPRSGESPHTVLVEKEVTLYHVSQLPKKRQADLLAKTPRFVLLECFEKPFVRYQGLWKSPRRLGFHEPLRRSNIPNSLPSTNNGSNTSEDQQPLLWVCGEDIPEGCIGAPLLRHIVRIERVFHSSQLITSSNEANPPSKDTSTE